MPFFKNPNEPRQPAPGVYEWYFNKEGTRTSLYIGQAGKKDSYIEKSTLMRGIAELARTTFSSDGTGHKLDTDFIVGCAIRFVEDYFRTECIWEHISNDPNEEKAFCSKRKPFIQDPFSCEIYTELKCQSNSGEWYIARKMLEEKKQILLNAEKALSAFLPRYIK